MYVLYICMHVSMHLYACMYVICMYVCMNLCLFPGGFSAAQWSVRQYIPESAFESGQAEASVSSSYDNKKVDGECSSSSAGKSGLVATRSQRNVFENRDLCRIISTFIPTIKI